MKKLLLRRHYSLLLALFVVIVFLVFGLGDQRIIAYTTTSTLTDLSDSSYINYENDIDIFDETVVHEISIDMPESTYETMITTYQETGEKDYFYADITIDGMTMHDVGIRLKGNLTLTQALGGSPTSAGGGPGGGERPEGGMAMERPDFALPEGFEPPEDMAFPDDGGMMGPGGGMMNNGEESNPPFLIKFDEFLDQTYEGYAEIALRLGSDDSLLGEPVAFAIHEEVGQIVPETAYAAIEIPGDGTLLYVIAEHPDENYVEKHFENSDGILYKAGNFVGFDYLGDDPSLYADLFEQKTNKNEDDLYPLIEFFKFVSESSDEEFEAGLPDWIDMDSFVRMMALDNLLSNSDSFVGMGSNYYLYYDKETEQFTMLSWDQNLAMGGMGGGMGGDRGDRDINPTDSEEERQQIFDEWLEEGGFDDGGGMGPGGNSDNLLKTRFFENETFSALYDAEYERLKTLIFDEGLAEEQVGIFVEAFTDYNSTHAIMEQSDYDAGVESILSFINSN